MFMVGIVDKVIERGGGVTALARGLGISASSVCGWRDSGRIPERRVVGVSRLTGIPVSELRPEFFCEPNADAA